MDDLTHHPLKFNGFTNFSKNVWLYRFGYNLIGFELYVSGTLVSWMVTAYHENKVKYYQPWMGPALNVSVDFERAVIQLSNKYPFQNNYENSTDIGILLKNELVRLIIQYG